MSEINNIEKTFDKPFQCPLMEEKKKLNGPVLFRKQCPQITCPFFRKFFIKV